MGKTISMVCVLVFLPLCARAQHSTVYATVVSTKLFVVGAANPKTGLFYQSAGEDTVWRHTGHGNIRAFGVAVHTPARGQLVYITSGNGAHRTTDGGKSWKITTGWQVTEVLCAAIDPNDSQRVYISTPYGIFKTTDGGETWLERNDGLRARFISSVIIDQSNSKVLYCATEDGVYRSGNSGATWNRTSLSVKDARLVVQHPRNPHILFVGTGNDGIYYTTNGGNFWEKSEAGLDHTTFYTIAFDPKNPDTMYAGGYVTGVYKSLDGGKSWNRVNDGLMALNVHSICVDPNDSNRVYAATLWGGVFRSENGGAVWQYAGLGGSQVWSITVQPF